MKIFKTSKEKLTHLSLQDSSSSSKFDTVDVGRRGVISQMCYVDDANPRNLNFKNQQFEFLQTMQSDIVPTVTPG